MRVVCRFRPQSELEAKKGGREAALFDESNPKSITITDQEEGTHSFSFDHVFNSNTPQEAIFETVGVPAVKSVMEGYNGTVFAYGQTSSGKTHTMEGVGLNEERGLIPRMLESLHQNIQNAPEGVEFSVSVSMIEIYMEKINDLLDSSQVNLQIREDPGRGIWVDGCKSEIISQPGEFLELMKVGQKNRVTGSTNMNMHSSRSHSLFMVTVHQRDLTSLATKSGKLFLVDLAGSEKVRKTGARGTRLEEAKTINKSLSTLGNVINSLTDGVSTHVPYRDSKLTRVLQESLGGNARTALVICCSPSSFNFQETVSTLRFGARAKLIRNKAKINHEHSAAEMKLLLEKAQKEISSLQFQLTLNFSGGSEELKEKLQEQNDEMHQLRESVVDLRSALKTQQKRDIDLTDQVNSLQMNIDDLEYQLAERTSSETPENQEDKMALMNLEALNTRQTFDIRKLENDLLELRENIQNRDTTIKAKNTETEALTKKLIDLEYASEQNRAHQSDLESSNSSQIHRIQRLEEQVTSLSNEVTKQQLVIDKERAHANTVEEEIRQLNSNYKSEFSSRTQLNEERVMELETDIESYRVQIQLNDEFNQEKIKLLRSELNEEKSEFLKSQELLMSTIRQNLEAGFDEKSSESNEHIEKLVDRISQLEFELSESTETNRKSDKHAEKLLCRISQLELEMSESTETTSKSDEHIEKLVDRISQLEFELSESTETNCKSGKHVKTLLCRISQFELEMSESVKTTSKSDEHIEKLMQRISQLESEMSASMHEHATLLETYVLALTEADEENKELKSELDKQQSSNGQLATLDQEKDRRLQELENELESKQSLEIELAKYVGLQNDVLSLRDKALEYFKTIEFQNQTLEAMKAKQKSISKDKLDIENELGTTIADLKNELKNEREIKISLNTEIATLKLREEKMHQLKIEQAEQALKDYNDQTIEQNKIHQLELSEGANNKERLRSANKVLSDTILELQAELQNQKSSSDASIQSLKQSHLTNISNMRSETQERLFEFQEEQKEGTETIKVRDPFEHQVKLEKLKKENSNLKLVLSLHEAKLVRKEQRISELETFVLHVEEEEPEKFKTAPISNQNDAQLDLKQRVQNLLRNSK